MIGILNLHLHLPGCSSLKEKRGRIRPLMSRLRREFNLSVAEMGFQDQWQEALIACAMVGNEGAHLQSALHATQRWVKANWPDGMIVEDRIEIV
ncbi:MAG TPA: DUF503 domain-containing protein [Anaerolineales bacterium]|nr:DUF503 domain-containing protein [Anaerolineales bacterium]